MIKKCFLVVCFFLCLLMGYSLNARRFEHRGVQRNSSPSVRSPRASGPSGHRPQTRRPLVRSSQVRGPSVHSPRVRGPRVSVSYGVNYPIYATYPYRDRWMRYRPYRYYGGCYSDYPYYSVVYDLSGSSYRDDQVYYENKRKKQVEQVYVSEREYQGIPLICVEIPSVDRSLYDINGRSYASLYALYAALRLKRYDLSSSGRAVIQLKESKERFYRQAESLGLMHSGFFRDFTKKAFSIIRKERQQNDSLKSLRGSITFCTEDDLKQVVHAFHETVIVGYDPFFNDADSINSLLEFEVPALREKESKVFCLPFSRNSREWAAIKLEKKGGIVYGVMIKVY